MRLRTFIGSLAAVALVFSGCSDDDAAETADRVEDTARDAAEDIGEAAEDAWASFRTGAERLVDEAATGDNEARDELLDECRDTLEEMRQDDDPEADRVGELCDDIRDADDETAWDEIRQEIEEIDDNR